MKIAVVGGGAAGFFAALAAKEFNPHAEVMILERSDKLLSKVKISGGGRCNVTHGCFDPRELIRFYPRGGQELQGAFHRFQPKDTIEWFKARGVSLKMEEDGRLFPTTDSSVTIINCFLNEAKRLDVVIRMKIQLRTIQKLEEGFNLTIEGEPPLFVDRLILATGSFRMGYSLAISLGHTIQETVPSLFTLNIPSFPLQELAGVSLRDVIVQLEDTPLEGRGAMVITHSGFSGPAFLRLSAFAARPLATIGYKGALLLDWLPDLSEHQLQSLMEEERRHKSKKQIGSVSLPSLPKSLYRKLIERAKIPLDLSWNSLSNTFITQWISTLKRDRYEFNGKSLNKEEFVTCGGVTLTEIRFTTMESRICSGLFFAGELLDIDAVTGGFNFQAGWTTGWLAGRAAAE